MALEETFYLPILGGRVYRALNQGAAHYRRGMAEEQAAQNNSVALQLIKIIAMVVLLPITFLSLAFREVCRYRANINLINPQIAGLGERSQVATNEEVSLLLTQILTPSPSAVFSKEELRGVILNPREISVQLAEILSINDMTKMYISEIIPGLILGGDSCGSFINTSYPKSLAALDQEHLVYGYTPSYKKPADAVSFNSGNDPGVFDVVVSANSDWEKEIPANGNRSTPTAFLKEGGEHILTLVVNENFDKEAFVAGVDQAISALKEGKLVYVHCAQGCDRSTSVVIAMLHKMTDIAEDLIIKFVASKRCTINRFLQDDNITKNFKKCMDAVKESMAPADS